MPGLLPEVLAISPALTLLLRAAGGLIPPETRVTLEQVRDICCGDVDPASARYRVPLDRDLRSLSELATDCQIVLLGSVATPKYVDPLLEILGERLFFPVEFVGRGDIEPRWAPPPMHGCRDTAYLRTCDNSRASRSQTTETDWSIKLSGKKTYR